MDQQAQATYLTAIPSAIIAAAAVWISFNQNRLETKKAQRELFEHYNQRFDKLNENLNRVCENQPLDGFKTSEEVIQDYLNLCSEEYLSMTDGLVSEKVWTAWIEGINYYLRFKPIQDYFKHQRELAPNSYYGFFNTFKIS